MEGGQWNCQDLGREGTKNAPGFAWVEVAHGAACTADTEHVLGRLWEKTLEFSRIASYFIPKIRECHTFNPGCLQSFPEDPCCLFLSLQPFPQPHTQPFPDTKASRTYKAVLSLTIPSAWHPRPCYVDETLHLSRPSLGTFSRKHSLTYGVH